MNEPRTTLVGNVAGEVELRFTTSGVAVCKLRVAQTPRVKKGDEYVDGDPFWINITCWRKLGENVAESIKPGMRIIAEGRLSQRSYDHKDGYKVTVVEFEADSLGAELTFATAEVTKAAKSGGGGARTQGDDEWAGATKERPAAAATNTGPSADTQRTQQAAAPPSNDW